MVIGDGLIGRSFHSYINNNEYLIFASGVSSSMEDRESEFLREEVLLKKYTETDMKLIYFSSVNVNSFNRPYFLHKIKMENYIEDNFKNYIIFRLPQVIGFGGNKNNLFSFFKNNIVSESVFSVEDSFRSLIDVEDVIRICEICFHLNNYILNISSIEKIKIIDMVNIISEELNIIPKVDIINTRIDGYFTNSNIIDDIINDLKIEKCGYTRSIIKKYINN